MIIPDTNLLLYAHISEFAQHQASKAWLEKQISDGVEIGLSWQVITAFVRIGTNPRLFGSPMTIEQIENIFEKLFSQPNVKIIVPTARHWEIFSRLLKETNAKADLVMDAHLAALAIENNAELASTDRDFKQFSGLQFSNPLKS